MVESKVNRLTKLVETCISILRDEKHKNISIESGLELWMKEMEVVTYVFCYKYYSERMFYKYSFSYRNIDKPGAEETYGKEFLADIYKKIKEFEQHIRIEKLKKALRQATNTFSAQHP